MDDYISKSYLIKAFSIFNDKKNRNKHYLNGIETAIEVIENAPVAEVAPIIYGHRFSTKKHKWKRKPSGEIDFTAWTSGLCNGPICLKCGKHFCIHCAGDKNAIKSKLELEDCFERSECSVCGKGIPNDALYCPSCGAKMDLEV